MRATLALSDPSMNDADSADLVARAASGDRDAFRCLVERYHTTVFRWAFAACGDQDDADDVAQAVWIRVYAKMSSYRGGAKFSTWLYRITFNTSVELTRTRTRRASALDTKGAEAPEEPAVRDLGDDMDASHITHVIRRYLGMLPPRQRAIFDLADLRGYGPAEIAELLGTQEVTVRTNLFRARRAIRTLMLQEEPQLMQEIRP
jgi:RNA polymerase sigma-70 factor (ECF subfamily)